MSASKVWVTADSHLFHLLVAGLRGYESVADWNEHYCERWCELVKPKDQVWLLGDLTGGGHLIEALDLIDSLPGEKHLILGNHDRGHPMHRDSHRSLRLYHRTFASVQLHARRRINGINTMVSHFSYTGDHTEADRYREWRLPDHGVPIIHGHTHSSVRTSYSPAGTVQVNVAYEAWHRLVEFDELLDFLR